jgi:Periplasmic copper-binding protein (NosD)
VTLRDLSKSLAAVLVLSCAPVAGAADGECTAISSLPYTINASGPYCLTRDLAFSLSTPNFIAITINANSVVVDLRGYKIGAQALGPQALSVGIIARDRRNVVVKNGTVRGFMSAVEMLGGEANIVEDLIVEASAVSGIIVSGTGCVIRRNLVVNTGLTGDPTHAILVDGTGLAVVDNDIANSSAAPDQPLQSLAIAVNASSTVVERNRIANMNFGILVRGTDVLVSDNRLTNTVFGIYFTGTGKSRDTLTSSVTTPYTGGTDAGNNN